MKKFVLIFLFLSLISNAYGDNSGFKYSGDVVYFEDEGEERERIYTLKVGGEVYSLSYPAVVENGKNYFSVFEFFKAIGFTNYEIKKGKLTFSLGQDGEKKVIDFGDLTEKEYIYENRDYYISEELFKEHFAQTIRIDENKYEVSINPSFLLPKVVNLLLNAQEKEIDLEKGKPILYYKSERKLFDLGNLRVNLEKSIEDSKSEGKSHDWDGYLEYSGALLYGIFNTNYDLKEHEFGDFTITYSDLLDGQYELELGAYGEHREKGLTFQKDRGYLNNGKEYIIEEKVPLGSRVELLYNNIPIEIQYEEGGKVVFINNLIKENREFLMRIFTQDGKILERKIKINDDYNQQNKGEFGYDIYIRDEHDSNRVNSQMDIYYGYTDHLTFGFGYDQIPEEKDGKYLSVKTVNLQTIYGNSFYGNPYTLKYELKKGINSINGASENSERKYVDKKYNTQHNFMVDTTIKDFSINYEIYENGKYYDEKREQNLDLDYDVFDWLTLTYEYENTKYHDSRGSESDYKYGAEFGYSINSLLLSYEIDKNKAGDITHEVDLYYTGLKHVLAKVENSWDEKGDYTGELRITNKTWSEFLDYSFGVKYTPKEDTRVVLDFTLKLDNWLELGAYWAKDDTKSAYIGIDRVFNLKKPTVNMNNLDSTNIKVMAFLDGNNNNKYDKGEEAVPNVDVKLGDKTIVTDENGIGYIYGVTSFIDYELETSCKRPTFKSDINLIKVRGTGSSEVVAYVPVKPMISFTGFVDFKNATEFDKENIISDLAINVTNKDNTFTQTIYPDSTGMFYIFDIIPDDYTFTFEYRGDDYVVDKYKENIKLLYTDKNRGENEHTFILNRGE